MPSESPTSTTMTPLGPKVLAKDFATPGSMSVDTPAQKKKDDDWWGDESWHGSGSWDAHGWDAWYRGTPSSWDGSWSAGEWQASSVQWGRRGAVDSLSAPEIKAEETQPDLETLLERGLRQLWRERQPGWIGSRLFEEPRFRHHLGTGQCQQRELG